MEEKLILGKNHIYSPNPDTNNNCLCIAASGAGKSYSFIMPNLLSLSDSSNAVVVDPKGVLYNKTKTYFKNLGFNVYCIDLDNLTRGTIGWDALSIADSELDLMHIIHALVFGKNSESTHQDVYWDRSAEQAILAVAALSLCLNSDNYFLNMLDYSDGYDESEEFLDSLFYSAKAKKFSEFGLSMYKKVVSLRPTERTYACVISSVRALLYNYSSEEFKTFLKLKSFSFDDLVYKKTILFVKVSDSSSLFHGYASLFVSQLFRYLFSKADLASDNKLQRGVKFFMDDFASSLQIEGFDQYLSTARSRNISFFLSIQSEAQLKKYYGDATDIIIANCDNLLYLGSTDLETCENLSRRLDKPLSDVLYMKKGEEYIFRRGSLPVKDQRYDYKRYHPNYPKLYASHNQKNGIHFPQFEKNNGINSKNHGGIIL